MRPLHAKSEERLLLRSHMEAFPFSRTEDSQFLPEEPQVVPTVGTRVFRYRDGGTLKSPELFLDAHYDEEFVFARGNFFSFAQK